MYISIGVSLFLMCGWLFTWGLLLESNHPFSYLRTILLYLLLISSLLEVYLLQPFSFMLISQLASLLCFFDSARRLPDGFVLESGTSLSIFVAAVLKSILSLVGASAPLSVPLLLLTAWLFPISYLLTLPVLEPSLEHFKRAGGQENMVLDLWRFFKSWNKAKADPRLSRIYPICVSIARWKR